MPLRQGRSSLSKVWKEGKESEERKAIKDKRYDRWKVHVVMGALAYCIPLRFTPRSDALLTAPTWHGQVSVDVNLTCHYSKLRLQLCDFWNDTYSLAEVLQDRVFNDLDAKTAQYRSNFLHPQLQDDDKSNFQVRRHANSQGPFSNSGFETGAHQIARSSCWETRRCDRAQPDHWSAPRTSDRSSRAGWSK